MDSILNCYQYEKSQRTNIGLHLAFKSGNPLVPSLPLWSLFKNFVKWTCMSTLHCGSTIAASHWILFGPWIFIFLFFLAQLAGLPYYTGVPGVPSAFQYGPTVFVPPASAKQPAMGLANPSNQYHQQHQPSYGQHAAYGTGKSRSAAALISVKS